MARKRRVETIVLYPNPYHCMGKDGALGGGVPVPEAFHGGALPARQYVGAEMKHENFLPGPEGRESRSSRADRFFVFEIEAREYEIPKNTRADFLAMIRDGAVLEVEKVGDIPVGKLADARVALIVEHASHATDEDPDFEFWQEQFSIDDQIAKLCAEPLKEQLAALEKRKQEAIASRADAAQAAESPKPVDPSAAVKEAQERAAKAVAAAMKPPQAETPPTTPSSTSALASASAPEVHAAQKPPKGASAPKES